MKKIFVSMMLLMAAMSTKAQMTAEAIMALMPDIPTLAEMIQWEKDSSYPLEDRTEGKVDPYVPFYEALDAAKEKAKEGVQKTLGPSLAHKVLQSKVGNSKYSVSQFQNMSESQKQQVGQDMANDMLAGMGLSAADIAKMQSGNMSEADEQAIANKILQSKTGGMSVQDVQFMQGMTDKERAQFMEMSGLSESGKAKIKENQAKQKKDARMVKEGKDMDRYDRHANEIKQKIFKRKDDVIEAGRELYDSKYAKQIDALQKKMFPYVAILESGTSEEIKVASAKINELKLEVYALECDFYEKWLPTWRNAITDAMDICRAELLPVMEERKIVTDKLYKETKSAEYAEGAVFPITAALEYLDIPEDIGDFNGRIIDSSHERRSKLSPDDARNARDTDGNPYDKVEE